MKQIKSAPPETMRQALEWDQVKRRYVTAGLCEKCAGQAAYGHQQHSGGWLDVNPPCAACAPVVSRFPLETTNPAWRKAPRSRRTPAGSGCHQIAAQTHEDSSHAKAVA